MKKTCAVGLFLLLAVLAFPATALTMRVDVPLPIIVGNSDLIVIGKVTEEGASQEMEFKNPQFDGKTRKGWYRTFKVKVSRVLGQDGQASKLVGEEIEVLAMAKAPAPPPAPPVPGGGIVLRQPIIMDGVTYPNLQTGKSYVLILNTLSDRNEHYLPSDPKNYRIDTDPQLKEIEKLADKSKWPWGKVEQGLQMACLVSGSANRNAKTPSAFIQASVAVRNVSDKPIALNLYSGDRCMQVTATAADGKTFSPDMYRGTRNPEFDVSKHTIVVKPNELTFIGPSGSALYGLGFNLPLEPGLYHFYATYTNSREGKGADNVELWTGTIKSEPTPLEIKFPG